MMEKRRQNLDKAIQIWQEAVDSQEIFAYIELAKVYEHRLQDYAHALALSSAAIQVVRSSSLSTSERSRLITELEHRTARLQRKHQGWEINQSSSGE
jgi:hypothetical protein